MLENFSKGGVRESEIINKSVEFVRKLERVDVGLSGRNEEVEECFGGHFGEERFEMGKKGLGCMEEGGGGGEE